jgi:hypothetical protein
MHHDGDDPIRWERRQSESRKCKVLSEAERDDSCCIDVDRVRIKPPSVQFPGTDGVLQAHANDVLSVVDISEFERTLFVRQNIHGGQRIRRCTSSRSIGYLNADSASWAAAFIEE